MCHFRVARLAKINGASNAQEQFARLTKVAKGKPIAHWAALLGFPHSATKAQSRKKDDLGSGSPPHACRAMPATRLETDFCGRSRCPK